MNKTFVRCSSFWVDVKSSHWNARLILANANTPLGSRSLSLFADVSWVMTRETNDELLLMILFFGFLLRDASFALTGGCASAGFPSPKRGAVAGLRNVGGFLRGSRLTRESLTPEVGGCGTVARGFGFTIGASEGCGGGVANKRSSLRV